MDFSGRKGGMEGRKKRKMEKMEPKRKNPIRKKKCVENPQRKLESVQHKKPTLVIIDLETTGLIVRGSLMPHITQLAVKEMETGVSFSVYVMPKMKITAKAGELTGISVDLNGDMLVNEKRVECVSIQKALTQLQSWLNQFDNVVLVAHNGKEFDFRILMSALKNNNMIERFLSSVTGFVDSFLVFKQEYPFQSKHAQAHLARQLLGISYNEHNAEADVQTLAKLVGLCTTSELLSYKFLAEDIMID